MNQIIIVLFGTLAIFTFSRSTSAHVAVETVENTIELSTKSGEEFINEVRELILNYDHRLPDRDRRLIQRELAEVISIFADHGFYVLPKKSLRHLYCDLNDNSLRELQTHNLLWDFATPLNCNEALVQISKNEPFCDLSNYTLRKPDGSLIHDFRNESDCRNSRISVIAKKSFCDFSDNTIYNHEGQFIFDFATSEECINERDQK